MKKQSKFGTLLAFIFKSTKIMKGLKVLKSLKLVKPLITVLTMFMSLLVYGWVFGWVFAVGIITMIFIHEMGHVIALKMKHYKTSAPVFIPMLGAFIFAPRNMDRETEAFVGIGGPILGTLGAIAAWVVWSVHPDHPMIYLIMSYIGIMINLFNMLPIRPLDGGRVTQAVGNWFSWIGIGLLLLLTIAMKDPGLLLIWILVLDDFDRVPIRKRAIIGSIVWITMTILILSGYGVENNTLGYIMDIFLGLLFCLLLVMPALQPNEERLSWEKEVREKSGSNRPALSLKNKIKWFLIFLITCIVLIVFLWKQQESIAPWIEEQKRKEQQTHPPKTIGENRPYGSIFL
jgi:Zn-dependent protease